MRNVCSNPDCSEFVVAWGLCDQHYRRTKADERKAARALARAGRSCRECGSEIPIERNSRAVFCSIGCKTKHHNAIKSGNPDHAARLRSYLYASKYGITVEDYAAMSDRQGGQCAVCSTTEPGGRGRFHVDHCHESGTVRGLLCTRCNTGLGQFGDDVETLQNAINYLRLHPVT